MAADVDMVLPDLLQPGLALVFCGTAAGKRSAAEHAYYAHPGNLFWRALHEARLTPRRLAPSEFPVLPGFGIGLTDLAKRHSGNDNQLPPDAFDVPALHAKIAIYTPHVLAFTREIKHAETQCWHDASQLPPSRPHSGARPSAPSNVTSSPSMASSTL